MIQKEKIKQVGGRFDEWFKEDGEYEFNSATEVLAFTFSELEAYQEELVQTLEGMKRHKDKEYDSLYHDQALSQAIAIITSNNKNK